MKMKHCPLLDGQQCRVCGVEPVRWFSTRDPDYFRKNQNLRRMIIEAHARNWQAGVDRMALVPMEAA